MRYKILPFLLVLAAACTTAPQSTPEPASITIPDQATDVMAIVANSPCTTYSWQDRQVAKPGYVKGLARSFQRSVCRYRSPKTTPAGVIGKPVGDPAFDALAYNNLDADTGVGRIIEDYTLLIGLGMRESGGNYGEGFDASAGTETASEAEAGAFQFSYNSISASPQLGALYAEYQGDSASCLLSTYSEGARGSYQSVRGTGAGADFQALTKKCPGFQAEYAAVLTRVLRKHFGPINRKEVEIRDSCRQMFKAIESATTCN